MDSARARWDERYRNEPAPDRPSPFVASLTGLLPARGAALDLAGGAGRHAVWLAQQGLDVTLVDVSAAGLELAAAAAARHGVEVRMVQADFEVDPVPAGPWDVILCIHYLQRDLLPRIVAELAPGGLLACAIGTVRNLERHERPTAEFLLAEGELPGLMGGLDMISYEEGWLDEDRHEARIVARRPG